MNLKKVLYGSFEMSFKTEIYPTHSFISSFSTTPWWNHCCSIRISTNSSFWFCFRIQNWINCCKLSFPLKQRSNLMSYRENFNTMLYTQHSSHLQQSQAAFGLHQTLTVTKEHRFYSMFSIGLGKGWPHRHVLCNQ